MLRQDIPGVGGDLNPAEERRLQHALETFQHQKALADEDAAITKRDFQEGNKLPDRNTMVECVGPILTKMSWP